MTQTRIGSLIESSTSTLIGLITSFGIQLAIYPLLDIDVSLKQNLIITFVFFSASVIRGYIIRRVFNKIKKI